MPSIASSSVFLRAQESRRAVGDFGGFFEGSFKGPPYQAILTKEMSWWPPKPCKTPRTLSQGKSWRLPVLPRGPGGSSLRRSDRGA